MKIYIPADKMAAIAEHNGYDAAKRFYQDCTANTGDTVVITYGAKDDIDAKTVVIGPLDTLSTDDIFASMV